MSSHCARAGLLVAAAAAIACLGPVPARAASSMPEEGDCPSISGLQSKGISEDAAGVRLREGMRLGRDDLLALRELVPQEVWRFREQFFHEGMQLEIGPCYRRYQPAAFFTSATEKFAGKAKIDREDNLKGYTAGLPFPPDSIDPKADDAGARWAWDVAYRFRGAGHRGRFRITDFPGRIGGTQVYTGTWFLLVTSHRADLAASDYALPKLDRWDWIAGGEFLEPFNARNLAWRQYRDVKSGRDYDEPDDTFVYVPTMRKMRRSASSWVDGLFLPRYTKAGDGGGGGMVFGNPLDGSGGSIQPTAALSIAQSEDMRRGLTGIWLRPNAYAWRVLGERDVLAPINVSRDGYPNSPDRNWGESGLSIASDRWDLRRAVVIEGAARDPSALGYHLVTIYVDRQTQQPLYWITRGERRRFLEIGILGYRYTADVIGYPSWPDSSQTRVFEPVAAVFYDAGGGGGWRRESYDLVSTPVSESERTFMSNSAVLARGR